MGERRLRAWATVTPFVLVGIFALGMRMRSSWGVLLFILGCGALATVVAAVKGWRRTLSTAVETESSLLSAIGLAALLALPLFQITHPYLLYIESHVFVLAVALLALSVVLGLAGLVDLGTAAFAGIGAYTSVRFAIDLGVPVVLAPLLGAAAGAATARILALVVLRARGHYFSLATLAVGLVAYRIFIQADSLTRGTDGIPNIPGVHTAAADFTLEAFGLSISFPSQVKLYYWTLLCLASVYALVVRLGQGQLGRCLRATRDNETASQSSGVSVLRFRTLAYTIAGAISGFAGALSAHAVNYVSPGAFDFRVSVFHLALAVLAGQGRPLWCVFVAFGVVFLEEQLQEFGDLRALLVGAAILVGALIQARGGGASFAMFAGRRGDE